nr:unnamed protein product [Callosobruchus analis]
MCKEEYVDLRSQVHQRCRVITVWDFSLLSSYIDIGKGVQGKKGPAQSEGQNALIRHIKVDERLRKEVFPRMRPDKISLEAKSDRLICAFGARYLRLHRVKHFAVVTSRKMRELSKILMELKKLNPE